MKVTFGDEIQGFEESIGSEHEAKFLDIGRRNARRLGARAQYNRG